MPQLTTEQALALAVEHHRSGNVAQAESIYRQILAHDPAHARAMLGLGGLAAQDGRLSDAEALVLRAIGLDKNDAGLPAALGNIYMMMNRPDDAIRAYVRSLSLKPDMPDVHFQVGNASIISGRNQQAILAYRQAIAMQPDHQDAHCNLCNALIDAGDLDAAVAAAQDALKLWPTSVTLYRHLGRAQREMGRLDLAITALREGLEQVQDAQLHSDLLFSLHFHPDYDRRRLFEEHKRWDADFGKPHAHRRKPHTNDRSPERRLRVGYVAHDLGNHPLGRFMVPLLSNHNRQNVQVFVYCGFLRPGVTGDRLKGGADVWRTIRGLADDQIAEMIREDAIDILVDITMHSNGCKLPIFARKPAPVQVTYLAYCSTTGVDAIDYRLTDRYFDPPGPSRDLGEGALDRDAYYAEESVRLPDCYWCYPPPPEAPAVAMAPAAGNGYVTFGCLNEFSKMGTEVLATWFQLLAEVPDSRLLLHAKFGDHRTRLMDLARQAGIDPQRLRFVNTVPLDQYFGLYDQIDIALDPFPWAGGTTTLDALWMGVPVVSMAGDTGVSRGGLSILSNLGMADWVGNSREDYIQIAARAARDLPVLKRLRSEMRQRMSNSPLLDAPRFAAGVERAYREMWRRWCAGEAGQS
ncbi:MAG TPA: tetratricopeptide repeat protein [Tepidisphaeraceae bacterium]|jgi:predicted O-linked N-acetylglucosamine transferase (SPINDLY family)